MEPLALPPPDVEYRLAVRLLAQEPPLGRDILESLVGSPRRYRDLKVHLAGRRENVLTKALRRLREDGLIKQGLDLGTDGLEQRVGLGADAERVYSLTELGKLVVFRLHEMLPHAQSIQAYERGSAPAQGPSHRQRVLEAVRRSPGVTAAALAKDLGLGVPNLRHQLGFLAKQGLVDSVRSGRTVRFFPAGQGPSARKALLRRSAALLRQLSAHPGIRVADLSRRLHLSTPVVERYLELLKSERLVSERPDGYQVDPQGLVDALTAAAGADGLPDGPEPHGP